MIKKTILAWMLGGVLASGALAEEVKLENRFMKRELAVDGGVLVTRSIENKLAGKTLVPCGGSEFRLRISGGTDTPDTDVVLTAADFKVERLRQTKEGAVARLINAKHGLVVEVRYSLALNERYARKQLVLTASKPLTLERIDVEALAFKDAHQPYTLKKITARAGGQWSPGLGQPLYTTESATFWGIEFPAASNFVENNELRCGYLWGRALKAGNPYSTYPAVVGVGDDPSFIRDAFFDYIDDIRIRPLRLQVQFNTWFDFGGGISKEKFAGSVEVIHRELVEKRGCRPLSAYVIDDGWQERNQALPLWEVNNKFDPDFADSRALMDKKGSSLGLWFSPGCFFGAKGMVPKLREDGFESLELSMSMCGPKYMPVLEKRILELVDQEVQYFKFDGLFGHLNIRDFELQGRGCPAMPQLGVADLSPNDKALNNSKYDELKTYYLVAGTERLIEVFAKMAKRNPEVFIAITNGAYLSPWWLQHIDVVWMINAGDAAGGSDRTSELVYRDGRYHRIWVQENTQFPMSAIFNHEPKKKKNNGETAKTFRDYLFMNLSRGTGFVELYIKPSILSSSDWDVLAEGLKWTYDAFPAFRRVRMHGGNPVKGEVYGYSAWNPARGYVSMHNPSDQPQTCTFTLDRALGLASPNGTYKVTSPLEGSTAGLAATYRYGDTITINLEPKEIRLIDFQK